jgi:LacI family transcriptional regulator
MDGQPKTGRVTIRTVAADAGVSVAAVSKVLRNAYGVSDALRANVQAAIDRLGYRPTTAARGMRGRTFTMGILVTDLVNPYLAAVIDGINSGVQPAGFKTLIGVGQNKQEIETGLIESMIDHRMDGLILIAPRAGPDTLPRYAAQIPIVAMGHHEPGQTGFDTVNADDFEGARMAVRDLVAAGHRDIGMISLRMDVHNGSNVSERREDGYLAAMAAAGLSDRARISHMRQDPTPVVAEMLAWLTGPGPAGGGVLLVRPARGAAAQSGHLLRPSGAPGSGHHRL